MAGSLRHRQTVHAKLLGPLAVGRLTPPVCHVSSIDISATRITMSVMKPRPR